MARFDDGKAPDAMRTIGEVSAAFGIKPHVLRYWEQQFAMLQPLKRSGGRRLYRPEDIALVEQIDKLVNRQGYTLKGANKALLKGDVDFAAELGAGRTRNAAESGNKDDSIAQIVARLQSVRHRLAGALAD